MTENETFEINDTQALSEKIDDEEEEEWEELKADKDYLICKTYPHQIKRKKTNKIIKECISNNGYYQCCFNGKHYLKHRLIALQWIPNPDNLPEVDHKNIIKTDNHISNLCWCSRSDNQRNKLSNNNKHYIYFDKLPDTSERLESYNGHDLEGVYIDYENKKLYLFNGRRYRELIACRYKGIIRYRVRDVENKDVCLCYGVLFG